MPEESASARSQPEAGPFTLNVPKPTERGPDWVASGPAQSLQRIRACSTVEAAQAQATVEAVILLHSIRRTLIWTLVIVPLLALVFFITMVNTG